MIRLLPLLAVALATPALADLQKCVDAQGGTIYTDRDCPGNGKHAPAPANAPAMPAKASDIPPTAANCSKKRRRVR